MNKEYIIQAFRLTIEQITFDDYDSGIMYQDTVFEEYHTQLEVGLANQKAALLCMGYDPEDSQWQHKEEGIMFMETLSPDGYDMNIVVRCFKINIL